MAPGVATVGQTQVSLNPAWTPCPLQWAAAQLAGRSNHHFQPAFLPAVVLKLLNCLFQKALKNRSSLPSFHFFLHKCVLPEMAAVDRKRKTPPRLIPETCKQQPLILLLSCFSSPFLPQVFWCPLNCRMPKTPQDSPGCQSLLGGR